MSKHEEVTDSSNIIKGLGIVSIILAVIAAPIGLVASIATLLWARKAKVSTRLATWGIIISIAMIVVGIIVTVIVTSMLISALNDGVVNTEALCQHRDQWGWLVDSLRYACR